MRFVVGVFAPYICPQNSVLYMYTRALVCMCVRMCVDAGCIKKKKKKIGAKKFSEKSCKNIWSIKINA